MDQKLVFDDYVDDDPVKDENIKMAIVRIKSPCRRLVGPQTKRGIPGVSVVLFVFPGVILKVRNHISHRYSYFNTFYFCSSRFLLLEKKRRSTFSAPTYPKIPRQNPHRNRS